MEQILSLQQLADRLVYLEREVAVIRQEVSTRRRPIKTTLRTEASRPTFVYPWVNKDGPKQWFDLLFAALPIQGSPIGAEQLQRKMAEAELEGNELSRSIVAAREE